jgi:hypothetical protein
MKTETCKKVSDKSIHTHLLNIHEKLTNNYQTIAKSFNTYLLATADKIISNSMNSV